MKYAIITFIAVVSLASCTQSKKKLITGKWQAISLDNPGLDEQMEMQKVFLDTFGAKNTDEQNMEIYGFTNIDSVRGLLRQEMDDYVAMQAHAVQNTWFDFRKDGMVIMNFSGQKDSAKWSIDDAGNLALESADNDQPEKINMSILHLTDTLLKLQLKEDGMSSTVIFKPADK